MAIEDYNATIKSIEEISKDTRIFKLELDKGIDFRAGQYITFILEENGKKFTAPYSIASTPLENKTIEFAIKLVNSGGVTSHLWNKKEGDVLKLKGPMGGFGIKESKKEKIVFIGTGTGIAPFRSMIKELIENETEKNLTLIFGERFEDEVLFEEEFQELESQNKNFKFIKVISKPTENYKGKTGHVQENLEEIDTSNSDAYICGNPKMVEEVNQKLIDKGMSKESIFFEKY